MPFNGSGVFTRIYSWVADNNAGIDILPDRMDTDTNDIASGLEHCLTVNGETLPVSNLPMNNYHHTGASPGVNNSDYCTVGQVKNGGGGIPGGGFVPSSGGTMTGNLIVQGEIASTGSNSTLQFEDRAAVGQEWLWYANNGTAFLYQSGHGNLVSVDTSGNTDIVGYLTIGTGLTVSQSGYIAGGLTVVGEISCGDIVGTVGTVGGVTFPGGSVVDAGQINATNAGIAGGVTAAGLQVNGGANVTGNLTAGNLQVSGAGGFGTVNTSYLTVYINEQVNGTLTVLGSCAFVGGVNVQQGELLVGGGGISISGGGYVQVTGASIGLYTDSTCQCFNLVASEGTCSGDFAVDGLLHTPGSILPDSDDNAHIGQPGEAYGYVQAYAYNTSSDVRSKADIEFLGPDCLELVRAIAPKSYRRPGSRDPTRRHWGFVAQEVGEAMAAAGREFGGHLVDEKTGLHSLAYNELLALLWGAVQELAARS